MRDKNDDSLKKMKDDEEDVDIDDDMPATSFPPVMIERDEAVMIERDEGASMVAGSGQDHEQGGRVGGNASSSSSGSGSSSSDSSSSSGIYSLAPIGCVEGFHAVNRRYG